MSVFAIKDALTIVIISAATSALTEIISFHLIYKKPAYVNLRAQIEKNGVNVTNSIYYKNITL